MKTFEVEVHKTTYNVKIVKVQAKNEEEADKLAKKDDGEFKEVSFDVYVNGTEEL